MSTLITDSGKAAQFTIGVFARLTGISPGTLRIWERRYKIATPLRQGARDRRMYSQNDVDRLALVKALVDNGHPISTLAHLSIEELRARLKASIGEVSLTAVTEGLESRIVVLGDSLAIRLGEYKEPINGIEVCGVFHSAAELDDNAKALTPDVLVIEYATLQPGTPANVWRHLALTGARHAVVVYGFGTRRTLQELERAGIVCLQAPASVIEVSRACATARGMQVKAFADLKTHAAGIPARRFSAEQLARIAARATPIKCECPHHLVDLVNSLVAFETYSSECESLSPDDFKIHQLLHSTTAAARALLETGLAKVIEAEGISAD